MRVLSQHYDSFNLNKKNNHESASDGDLNKGIKGQEPLYLKGQQTGRMRRQAKQKKRKSEKLRGNEFV